MSEEALKLDSPWNEFLNEIDELRTGTTQIICIGVSLLPKYTVKDDLQIFGLVVGSFRKH